MDEPTAQVEEATPVEPADGGSDRSTNASKVDPTDLTIAFTPRQILGGFALLAALVMLLRRRNRDQDRSERD